MLIIRARVIEEMTEVQTEVGPNPSTEIRVGHILDKLFIGIVKNLSISRRIVEIQRRNRIILQTL